MMPLKEEDVLISEADYLTGEILTEFKNEYIDGHIYAMVGESVNHHRLSGSVYASFYNHLSESSCDVFHSGFKVRVGAKYFYPDVLVACDTEDDKYTENPTIIVEVLSPSTARYDRSFKLSTYKQIPSLIECVIIEQKKCLIEVHQRIDGTDTWSYAAYASGDNIHFKSIDLTLSVDAIFRNVNI